jgi:hypothetical protein
VSHVAPADLANAIRHDFQDIVDRMIQEGADPLGLIENESENPRGITVAWRAVVDGKWRYLPKLLGANRAEVPLAISGALEISETGEILSEPRRDIDAFEMLACLPRNQFNPALDALLSVMAPDSPQLAQSLWRLCEVLTAPGLGHPRVGNVNNITDVATVLSKSPGPTHLPPAERAPAWESLFSKRIEADGLPSARWGASLLSLCLFGHAKRTAQILKLAFADGLSPEATIDGHPLLILAVGRNNAPAVEVILDAGADIHRVHEMKMGYGIDRGDAMHFASGSFSNNCLQLLETYAAHAAVRATLARNALPR